MRKRKGENGPEYIGAKKKKTRKLFLFTHSFLGKRPARSCMYASRTLHKHASAMWKPRTTTKTGKRRQKKKRKTGRTIERSPGERGEERQKDRGTEPRNDGSGQRGNRGREKGGRRGEEERGSQPGVTYKARGTRKGRDQPSRHGETEKKCVKQKNEKVKKRRPFLGEGRGGGDAYYILLSVNPTQERHCSCVDRRPTAPTDRDWKRNEKKNEEKEISGGDGLFGCCSFSLGACVPRSCRSRCFAQCACAEWSVRTYLRTVSPAL